MPPPQFRPPAFPAQHLRAVGRSQLLARWPGTLSRILSAIQRAAETVLGLYLKSTCSRDTSASSAFLVLDDYALYKSTHALTHFCWPSVWPFNLPHLHLPPPQGVTPVEFRGDLWCKKTRVPALSCGVVCVIPSLAVLV